MVIDPNPSEFSRRPRHEKEHRTRLPFMRPPLPPLLLPVPRNLEKTGPEAFQNGVDLISFLAKAADIFLLRRMVILRGKMCPSFASWSSSFWRNVFVLKNGVPQRQKSQGPKHDMVLFSHVQPWQPIYRHQNLSFIASQMIQIPSRTCQYEFLTFDHPLAHVCTLETDVLLCFIP